MKKRLASLVLLLVLLGGAFAGVPLTFGGNDCDMSSMMDMDCCKKAMLQEITPEVADAKLCCALNCAQSGTTSPPNGVRVTPPAPLPAVHVALVRPMPIPAVQIHRLDQLQGPPGSTPTYLRNLTLLI
ncbi:MAG: hypothetical protein C5B46_02465 [Proteobacteria bacterium]|nr:MAG: hypothetical protein C5B46_02465 [Pseudomonadota bacterium]